MCRPPTSAKTFRDQSLLEALGIDTEPLFGEEIQIEKTLQRTWML